MPAGEFYALTTLATLGGFLMAGSLDLITIFLGLELLSIASYALAGLLKGDPRSQEASIKFFLVGALTTAVILFGISLLYGLAGTTSLTGIAAAVAGLSSAEFPLLAAAGLFLLAGLGVKIAAVPFHMWAPDTYDGAPTPVSAFLITASEAARICCVVAPVRRRSAFACRTVAADPGPHGARHDDLWERDGHLANPDEAHAGLLSDRPSGLRLGGACRSESVWRFGRSLLRAGVRTDDGRRFHGGSAPGRRIARRRDRGLQRPQPSFPPSSPSWSPFSCSL